MLSHHGEYISEIVKTNVGFLKCWPGLQLNNCHAKFKFIRSKQIANKWMDRVKRGQRTLHAHGLPTSSKLCAENRFNRKMLHLVEAEAHAHALARVQVGNSILHGSSNGLWLNDVLPSE